MFGFKKFRVLAALIGLLAAGTVGMGAANAQVNVRTYSSWIESPLGLTFSNQTGSETWATIDSNNILHPGQWNPGNFFAADITSVLSVPTTGIYAFSLTSDDGAYVFIDSILVASEPGSHSAYTTNFSTNLTAGNHSVEVQFYNTFCCGSSIQLGVDERISYTSAVPEPETYAMMLAGLGLLGFAARRRKQKALAA